MLSLLSIRLQALLRHATPVNASVENVETSVFKPDSLILCCSDSGKASFQQIGNLRLKQKLHLFPLLIFFPSSFTVQNEKSFLPFLMLPTFPCQCVLTAGSTEHQPTMQSVRWGHILPLQHHCPGNPALTPLWLGQSSSAAKDFTGGFMAGFRLMDDITPLCSHMACSTCPASQACGHLLWGTKQKCSSNCVLHPAIKHSQQ